MSKSKKTKEKKRNKELEIGKSTEPILIKDEKSFDYYKNVGILTQDDRRGKKKKVHGSQTENTTNREAADQAY